MTAKVEIDDIQAIVLTGYAHLNEAVYIFLHVRDGGRARAWLGSILPEVSSAAAWPLGADGRPIKPSTRINIAFTHAGLHAMGLSQPMLASFPAEFREGMAEPVRARLLGDVGASAPESWELGGPRTEPVHILVMLFAATPQLVEDLKVRYLAQMHEMDCVRIICEQAAARLAGMREHFGYRDGISQPGLEGTTLPRPGQEMVRPGEFVLGYQNEYDLLTPMPEPRALGQNGTYLVYRKLEQDVAAFNRFLDEQSGANPEVRERLAAKLLGRWPSGAPLALAPEKDDPALAADDRRNNDFHYAADDPYGYRTPLGAHIRRSNPRDGLEKNPRLSAITSRRHRIIRRGRPYGPPYSPETAAARRGLLFVAINTDIRRQFEFVQQVWLNDPKFAGLHTDKDPFATNHDGDNTLTIQRHPVRKVVRDLPRFVTVRAGGYFFVPGMRALEWIVSGPHG
ncbi:MAG: Dyp-type peroxidase [Chloroflexi bacterium]|nr:Dyp-type peroxidase [Chloroflexota bacterium]